MSKGEKRPFNQVLPIAQALVEKLRPVCSRIEIAGSLRRKRPFIGDIELMIVPTFRRNLFSEISTAYELDDLLRGWGGAINLIKDGDKYKHFWFRTAKQELYSVDLFIQPDLQTWGVNMMIRTGSADFSKRMVLKRKWGGLMPDDLSMAGARVFRHGKQLNTPEEGDVFKLWGMVYVKPEDRG